MKSIIGTLVVCIILIWIYTKEDNEGKSYMDSREEKISHIESARETSEIQKNSIQDRIDAEFSEGD